MTSFSRNSVPSLSLLLLALALAGACGGKSKVTPSNDASVDGNSSQEDGSAEDSGADATVDASPGVIIPPGVLDPTPYLQESDSPFAGVHFADYWYLENFEDHLLNTPGVSVDAGMIAFASYPTISDSVDGDDGDATDGTCTDCDDWFYGSGATGLNFTFDADALGGYPTHAGIVWTDGGLNCSVTFTAYDANDEVIYSETFDGIGDGSNARETAEDRFFGVVTPVGVKRLFISNTGGGIEVDHLQYGR